MKDLSGPTLIIDEEKCRANIRRMSQKASLLGVRFRPHFKTHQSAHIAEWFKETGTESITVSSVLMASYFAANGWDDISIAFPVNFPEIEEINKLASFINLNLITASEDAILFLNDNFREKAGVFVKIDAGYHRTGIDYGKLDEIGKIIGLICENKNLFFKGFLSHFGNTYYSHSPDDVRAAYKESISKLKSLEKHFIGKYPGIELSVGDTPSCSIVEDFGGASEIRPGNFVFYDLMQKYIGSCSYNDIAVSLRCPVVGKNRKRLEILIYGGAIHLSKEYILTPDNEKSFGEPVFFEGMKWHEPIENAYLISLSQEHGIVKVPEKIFDKISHGDIIGILPVHSCLAASLAGNYITTEGGALEKMY